MVIAISNIGIALNRSCQATLLIIGSCQFPRLIRTVPKAQEVAASNIKIAPVGNCFSKNRSVPIKNPRPINPRMSATTFRSAIFSLSRTAENTVAHKGMVNAMIEARPAGIFETPYAEKIIQPKIAKIAQNRTCPTSLRRIFQRLPEAAESRSKIEPPTTKQDPRNHQTGTWFNMIFIPGQLSPQNSDRDINSNKGVIDIDLSDIEQLDAILQVTRH